MDIVASRAGRPAIAPEWQTSVTNYYLGNDPATWRPGVPEYWLDVGTVAGPGKSSGASLNGSSQQVSNSPTNGSAVDAANWSKIGGGWQTPIDYVYTACSGFP